MSRQADDTSNKFQRYRAAQRARGMRLVRVWVPDPSRPGFHEEAARQAALLKGVPDEVEALNFIEAAGAWDD